MQFAIFLGINVCERLRLMRYPDFAENVYSCMLYDDACLKESILKKILLVVANLCNLRFFPNKFVCTVMTDH